MSPFISALTVLAWCGVLATLAFDGAAKRLEKSCTTHAPKPEACRRL